MDVRVGVEADALPGDEEEGVDLATQTVQGQTQVGSGLVLAAFGPEQFRQPIPADRASLAGQVEEEGLNGAGFKVEGWGRAAPIEGGRRAQSEAHPAEGADREGVERYRFSV